MPATLAAVSEPELAAVSEPELTLKEEMAAAVTERDHLNVVGRIGRMIVDAEKRHKELDDAREQAAIDGAVATEANNRARWDVGETVESLKRLQRTAEARRKVAQGLEIEAAMEAGIKAAHAMVPDVKALWIEFAGALQASLSVKDKLLAKIDEMNAAQAHAINRANPARGDGSTRDRIASAAQIRADAANEVTRPIMGASAPGPLLQLDNIALLAKVAVESILEIGVHGGDAHRARRDGVLSAVLPTLGPDNRPIVELATGTKGRPRGGFS